MGTYGADAMHSLIRALPSQLRWAAELDPPTVAPARAALVVGVGGSAIAGDIAAVVAEEAGARVQVHRSYGLPGWVDDELVIGVSHSGRTAETLSAVAGARGPVAVVSSGGVLGVLADQRSWPSVRIPHGPQPRAAVGHLTGGVLRLLEAAGVLPDPTAALVEAADVVEELLDGPAPDLARDLAASLEGRMIGVYGAAGAPAVAAMRWKCQINENSKLPAWSASLPESHHNEIAGWAARPDLGRDHVGIVLLRDPASRPELAARDALTLEVLGEWSVHVAGTVDARGHSSLARVFSLLVVGDLLSVELARRAGVDPMPVEAIQSLKARL